MIIDLGKFIEEERPHWHAFESMLDRLDRDPHLRLDLDEVKRFHYLYQRTSADLARIVTFSAERGLRQYLESLVARGFSEIHETRQKAHRFAPVRWFFTTFPGTFRRHVRLFWISVLITLAGAVFGAAAIGFDAGAKRVLMPFPHLMGDPSERVAMEEEAGEDRLKGRKSYFSSFLMTHNTKVSVFILALGITWGVGTALLLFLNGIMIGAIVIDYIMAGESVFLAAWLLPHGSIEIPAFLIAGQAGLILGGAMIGWSQPLRIGDRLRKIAGDLVTIIFGVAILLVWAGIIEAFLSQYHEPVIGYGFKIGLGIIELALLVLFLARAGKRDKG